MVHDHIAILSLESIHDQLAYDQLLYQVSDNLNMFKDIGMADRKSCVGGWKINPTLVWVAFMPVPSLYPKYLLNVWIAFHLSN